ncbi:MAG: hypothetical protein ACR2ME_09945 [Acidimicrobiia bacterium]
MAAAAGSIVELLTPRARWFYERYGPGPYTPAQFASMPGLIVEPTKEPEATPPAAVLAAMEQEDVAAIFFATAHQRWEVAVANVLRLGGKFSSIQPADRSAPTLVDSSGREISGRDQRKIAGAQDEERAAWQAREEAGVRLMSARVRSQEAQRQWRSTLYAAPR